MRAAWGYCRSGRRPTPGQRSGRDSLAHVRYEAFDDHPPRERISMTRMTTAEATVAALIAHGLDTIYALPGVHNDPLFDALFKASDRIRTVHTRHEQGASLMALGAALARREVPVPALPSPWEFIMLPKARG